MGENIKKLSGLANRFKVEELKQRIEFDIAMEQIDESAADKGWKGTIKIDPSTGKPYPEVSFSW